MEALVLRSRLGFELPASGPNTSAPVNCDRVVEAVRLAFGSVWTFERLMVPEENSYGVPVDLAWAYHLIAQTGHLNPDPDRRRRTRGSRTNRAPVKRDADRRLSEVDADGMVAVLD